MVLYCRTIVESHEKNATSIQNLLLLRNETSSEISKDFYAFDCQDSFVCIKVDMLTEQ